jgi:uncharacterized membrane protein
MKFGNIKSRAAFDKFLDLSTRSWFALAWNAAAGALYLIWNIFSAHPFDTYPFLFLCLIWTGISYYQNLIILAMQRDNEVIQKRQERLHEDTLRYLLHLMEAIHAQLKISASIVRSETSKTPGDSILGTGRTSDDSGADQTGVS